MFEPTETAPTSAEPLPGYDGPGQVGGGLGSPTGGPCLEGTGTPLDGVGAVAALRVVVDRLTGLDLPRLTGLELLDVVRDLEVQKRRLAGVDQALLAQLSLRHVAGEKGYRDTASLLVDHLRINPVEARLRVGDAADFGPSATLTGQPLPPVFPELAAEIGTGEISIGHARAITNFVDKLPASVPPEVVETAQANLMAAAAQTFPAQVARLATGLLARLDQDGPEPREEAEQRRRGFTLLTRTDGWSKPDGHLSPLLTAQFNALFDSLGGPKPAEDGTLDDRSPAARRHDALIDACDRLLCSGTLPDAGGTPITVLVTINETDLRERLADATSRCADPDPSTAHNASAGHGAANPDAPHEHGATHPDAPHEHGATHRSSIASDSAPVTIADHDYADHAHHADGRGLSGDGGDSSSASPAGTEGSTAVHAAPENNSAACGTTLDAATDAASGRRAAPEPPRAPC